MDKLETMSNEIQNVDFTVSLAQADKDVRQYLLSEIANEFKDEFEQKKEQVFYQDQVYEIIELAKHDETKKAILLCALVGDENIANELLNNYYDYFGSQGILKEQG